MLTIWIICGVVNIILVFCLCKYNSGEVRVGDVLASLLGGVLGLIGTIIICFIVLVECTVESGILDKKLF